MSDMDDELENFPGDDDEDDWCPTCQGSGYVAVADGYHEYIGYSYEACPDCEAGTRWEGRHGQRC